MDPEAIIRLLEQVRSGRLSPDNAATKLSHLPYEDMGFAKPDHHRHMRHGIPEVVYADGKTTDETVAIARALYKKNKRVLITRATKEVRTKLRIKSAEFHPRSGLIHAGGAKRGKGGVLVLSAGTSDAATSEEAALTARFLGSKVTVVSDVGVAGIHRLLDQKDRLEEAKVIVVVAGMEGALPSVVGGLTDRAIVAVPTSVGYGTSLGGLTALFAMLNSCVPGIAVMNIDNGFGAGCLAHRINTLAVK